MQRWELKLAHERACRERLICRGQRLETEKEVAERLEQDKRRVEVRRQQYEALKKQFEK